jgi:outer membrane protein OmpA-like peptidoglycan-associated protein
MMRPPLSALLLLISLGACAQRQALFVVLPNENGTVGAITVNDGQNTTTLDHPLAAEEMRNGQEADAKIDQNEVSQLFAAAFAARPILPGHFRFFFELGSDRLAAESAARYCTLYDDLKRRQVYEVEIVGHTDTLGEKAYDQELSLKRAETIRDALVNDGFDPRAISIAGEGYRVPLVPTPPDTAEPKNRRVEITTR